MIVTRKKRNGVKRPMLMLPVFLVAVVALVFTICGTASAWHTIDLDECEVFIEYNSTDGDFGVHFFWDGPPWKWMTIWNEHLWPVLNVSTKENMRAQGLTEGFFESAEPTLEELPFQDFLDRFPEDEYRFRGRTLDWKRLVCETEFTHVIPCPFDPEAEDPEQIGVIWEPGVPTLGVHWVAVTDVVELTQDIQPDELPNCIPGPENLIVGYEAVFELVVVLDDEEEEVYEETTTLPADATTVTASPQFTQLAVEAENAAIAGTIEGAELKVEVIAKEESGNSTITEIGVFELPEENGD
jgi:hypothetical protein